MALVAERLGKPFMPWQRHVADVLCEIDPVTGEFVYGEWGLTVPRQSGKSTFLLAKNVHRGSATKFFGPDQQMVYTAQTRKDARLKFEEDYVKVLKASRTFRAPTVEWRPGNGNEHLRFTNGSRWFIEANTEKAGHGGTLDEADIDEAFAHVDSRLEQAFEPAMVTRRNTRLGVVSTAGWIDGSPFLQAKVQAGRQAVALGQTSGLAYFEWSAPDDADPGELEVWKACMPALIHEGNPHGTQPLAAMMRRYEKAVAEGKLNDFRRAYLNQWVPKSSDEPPTISAELWAARRDDALVPLGALAMSVDVTPDRQRAYVAAATGPRPTGVRLVVECPPTEVVSEIMAFRQGRACHPVVVDPQGAAGALITDLERAGVPTELVSSTDLAQACGAFYDGTVKGDVSHVEHEALTGAVGNAVLRPSARGGSRWYPIGEGVPVSPLYAATLAVHGVAKFGPKDYDLTESVW